MDQMRFLEHGSGLLIAMLLLAGCAKAISPPTATSTPSPSATATAPAFTPTSTRTTIPPTATEAPTATLPVALSVTRPAPAPGKMPTGPGVEWQLMVVSESSGWGLGSAYASQIEKDVGVKVTLFDYAMGNLSARAVLDQLPAGTPSATEQEGLPAALSKSDVILVFPSPIDSLDDEALRNILICFGNIAGTPTPCTPGGFEKYTADLEAIWGRIFEYRSGKPTIFRALDYANPFVSRWNEKNIFDACTACWECVSAAARRAAEDFHIPFLSRYDIYNGMDHTIDPAQNGYIGADGIHPNNLAQQRSAGLLSGLGYEAVIPP